MYIKCNFIHYKVRSSMENNLNKNTYISVISSVATVAASRVEGVASVTNDSGAMYKLSFKSLSKGIDIEINNLNQVIINISINIKYGYNVPEVVCMVQEQIKKEVESNTSYKVRTINVNVVGVVIPD